MHLALSRITHRVIHNFLTVTARLGHDMQNGEWKVSFAISTRWMSGLGVALALMSSAVSAAGRDHDTVMAAGRVLGRIDGIEMKIGVCRDADPKNKDAYDRAFKAYNYSVQALMARLHYILREEAKRFGVPQDQFLKEITDAHDLGKAELMRQKAVNPSLFQDQCTNIANDGDHLPEELPSIKEQLPVDMHLIDN